jgi:hypothetical protein
MADSRESEPEVQRSNGGESDSFRAAEDSAAAAFRDELVSDSRSQENDSSANSNSMGGSSEATRNDSMSRGTGASSDSQRDDSQAGSKVMGGTSDSERLQGRASATESHATNDSASSEGHRALEHKNSDSLSQYDRTEGGRKPPSEQAAPADASTQEKRSPSDAMDETATNSNGHMSPSEDWGRESTSSAGSLDHTQQLDERSANSEEDWIGLDPPPKTLPEQSNSKEKEPPKGPSSSDAASSTIGHADTNQLEFPDIFTADQLGSRHKSDTNKAGNQGDTKSHQGEAENPKPTPDIIGMDDKNSEPPEDSKDRATERALPTGDTLEKRADGTQILRTPNGDKLRFNPDGSFSVEGNVKGISQKGQFTEIDFADGAKVTMDKKGILTVERADQAVGFSRLSDRERRPEVLKK